MEKRFSKEDEKLVSFYCGDFPSRTQKESLPTWFWGHFTAPCGDAYLPPTGAVEIIGHNLRDFKEKLTEMCLLKFNLQYGRNPTNRDKIQLRTHGSVEVEIGEKFKTTAWIEVKTLNGKKLKTQ